MPIKVCKNGHTFEKTSACPVCPICSKEEMNNKFGEEFPQISAPAFRALDHAGITSLKDLTKFSEKQLLSLHGFGPKGLRILKETMKDKNLSFMKE